MTMTVSATLRPIGSAALRTLAAWALPICVLAVWEIAAQSGMIASRLLPAPSAVFAAFWESLSNGTLIKHAAISTERALKGLLIGGGIGFVLGVLCGVSKPAETVFDSSMQMLRNVPHLAIIPLVIMWFGIDEEAKIFLVAIGTAFPIYLNTFHGIRTVDAGLIEMARVYGLGNFALFWRVILPGALPSILVGLRYALGIMWLTLIVAETISATSGIGYMTMNAREFLQTDIVVLRNHSLCAARKAGRRPDPRGRDAGAGVAPRIPRNRRVDAMNARAAIRVPEVGVANAPPKSPGRGEQGPGAQYEAKPIRVEGMGKVFGERRVLADIEFEIPAGQFVAVVGRSGCGKSTLLRLIAGLTKPNSGRIRIGGETVVGLQPSVRLLFQDARLLPWQRVIANVGISRGEGWRAAATEALEDVGLADRAGDWPSLLSGGQRQRVALARALVSRPSVLLLDEPFGALDALTRGEMHRLLDRIWREHGFTTVLITHDVSEAVALADRVIVLRDGGVALDVLVDRSRRGLASVDLQSRILDEV